jgi:hypothetical protein
MANLDLEAQQQLGANTTVGSSPYTPVQHGLASLAMTSASFLVSDSPIRSSSALLPLFTSIITPPPTHNTKFFETKPTTEYKAQLQEELHAQNNVIALQKQMMMGMQAQTVLQSMYLEGVRGQLQAQEEKKSKKRKTGKINMDGRAKILTQDDIIEGVKEWQDHKDKVVEETAVRKKVKEQYNAAMDIWKVGELDRKEQNVQLKRGWEDEVRRWGIARDQAKLDRRKPGWTKPKLPPMEKALCKPLLADFAPQEMDNNDNDSDGDGPDGDLMSDDSGS